MPDMMRAPDEGFDAMAPDNVSPLVVWLGSTESREVNGRVFEVEGGVVSVADGWQHGPRVDKGARWSPDELGPVVRELLDIALEIRPGSDEPSLDGSGLVVVNPPYTLEGELKVLLPALHKVLAVRQPSRWTSDWLAGEYAPAFPYASAEGVTPVSRLLSRIRCAWSA